MIEENLIAIYGSHDANICVNIKDEYRIFEIERFTKKRYDSLTNNLDYKRIYLYVKEYIKKTYNVENFNICLQKHLTEEQKEFLKEIWNIKTFEETDHHLSHAFCAYGLSNFDEALIITSDGGGISINNKVEFFNVYFFKKENDKILIKDVILKSNKNLGECYRMFALPVSEIKKIGYNVEKIGESEFVRFDNELSFPGKQMGLSSYGKIKNDIKEDIKFYYNLDSSQTTYNFFKKIGLYEIKKTNALSKKTIKTFEKKIELEVDKLSGENSYDLLATSQNAFEEVFFEEIGPIIEKYKNIPICLSGGCALNVILNNKIKEKYKRKIFVPPNPNDCGLSLGMIIEKKRKIIKNPDSITYSGYPIIDLEKFEEYKIKYNAEKIKLIDVCKWLNEGKIIAIMNGNSEVGPRALGNRSIICDPSFNEMKDILNSKVKFREWYRPFAPIIQREKCSKYFNFDEESPYMSFAPTIKDEWKEKYPSIVHVDNTSRVQTVTKKQNEFMYNLLEEFSKKYGKEILLNTSFNIKGFPILTTIEDAISVLKTTLLDMVIINGFVFKKIK